MMHLLQSLGIFLVYLIVGSTAIPFDNTQQLTVSSLGNTTFIGRALIKDDDISYYTNLETQFQAEIITGILPIMIVYDTIYEMTDMLNYYELFKTKSRVKVTGNIIKPKNGISHIFHKVVKSEIEETKNNNYLLNDIIYTLHNIWSMKKYLNGPITRCFLPVKDLKSEPQNIRAIFMPSPSCLGDISDSELQYTSGYNLLQQYYYPTLKELLELAELGWFSPTKNTKKGIANFLKLYKDLELNLNNFHLWAKFTNIMVLYTDLHYPKLPFGITRNQDYSDELLKSSDMSKSILFSEIYSFMLNDLDLSSINYGFPNLLKYASCSFLLESDMNYNEHLNIPGHVFSFKTDILIFLSSLGSLDARMEIFNHLSKCKKATYLDGYEMRLVESQVRGVKTPYAVFSPKMNNSFRPKNKVSLFLGLIQSILIDHAARYHIDEPSKLKKTRLTYDILYTIFESKEIAECYLDNECESFLDYSSLSIYNPEFKFENVYNVPKFDVSEEAIKLCSMLKRVYIYQTVIISGSESKIDFVIKNLPNSVVYEKMNILRNGENKLVIQNKNSFRLSSISFNNRRIAFRALKNILEFYVSLEHVVFLKMHVVNGNILLVNDPADEYENLPDYNNIPEYITAARNEIIPFYSRLFIDSILLKFFGKYLEIKELSSNLKEITDILGIRPLSEASYNINQFIYALSGDQSSMTELLNTLWDYKSFTKSHIIEKGRHFAGRYTRIGGCASYRFTILKLFNTFKDDYDILIRKQRNGVFLIFLRNEGLQFLDNISLESDGYSSKNALRAVKYIINLKKNNLYSYFSEDLELKDRVLIIYDLDEYQSRQMHKIKDVDISLGVSLVRNIFETVLGLYFTHQAAEVKNEILTYFSQYPRQFRLDTLYSLLDDLSIYPKPEDVHIGLTVDIFKGLLPTYSNTLNESNSFTFDIDFVLMDSVIGSLYSAGTIHKMITLEGYNIEAIPGHHNVKYNVGFKLPDSDEGDIFSSWKPSFYRMKDLILQMYNADKSVRPFSHHTNFLAPSTISVISYNEHRINRSGIMPLNEFLNIHLWRQIFKVIFKGTTFYQKIVDAEPTAFKQFIVEELNIRDIDIPIEMDLDLLIKNVEIWRMFKEWMIVAESYRDTSDKEEEYLLGYAHIYGENDKFMQLKTELENHNISLSWNKNGSMERSTLLKTPISNIVEISDISFFRRVPNLTKNMINIYVASLNAKLIPYYCPFGDFKGVHIYPIDTPITVVTDICNRQAYVDSSLRHVLLDISNIDDSFLMTQYNQGKGKTMDEFSSLMKYTAYGPDERIAAEYFLNGMFHAIELTGTDTKNDFQIFNSELVRKKLKEIGDDMDYSDMTLEKLREANEELLNIDPLTIVDNPIDIQSLDSSILKEPTTLSKYGKILFRLFYKESDEDCTICTESKTVASSVFKNKFCKHSFHVSCIKEWIKTPGFDRNCPYCRTKIGGISSDST